MGKEKTNKTMILKIKKRLLNFKMKLKDFSGSTIVTEDGGPAKIILFIFLQNFFEKTFRSYKQSTYLKIFNIMKTRKYFNIKLENRK